MFRNAVIFICIIFIIGCASYNTKTVRFSRVTGDVQIRLIASDNQATDGAATTGNASTPGMGSVPPIQAAFSGTGMFTGCDVVIEDVSGSVYIEGAGNRNQGIRIPPVIERLFVPGDPFAITE